MTATRGTLHVATSVDERMGGSVRAPLNVALSLSRLGSRAEVVATHASTDDTAYLVRDYPEVPVHLFARRTPHHNFRSPSLFRWLRANVSAFDVVDVHGVFSFPVLYAVLACRIRSVPYVIRPHGQLEPYDLRKHALLKEVVGRLFVAPMLRGSRAVLTATTTEAARLRPFGAPTRTLVAPLPIFEPRGGGDGASFRRRHGIPSDATVMTFLGRLDHKKGLQFLIPALARLKPDHPRLWFLLAGAGEPDVVAHYERLVDQHGVASWTTRSGFVSGAEKQSAFAATDCFVLPSLNENFGIVVIEALQAGVPVVVSTEVYVGQVPIAEGVGQVCDPDEESVVSALATLLADPDRMRAMAAAAPGVARSHFSPESAARVLLEQYDRALEGVGS